MFEFIIRYPLSCMRVCVCTQPLGPLTHYEPNIIKPVSLYMHLLFFLYYIWHIWAHYCSDLCWFFIFSSWSPSCPLSRSKDYGMSFFTVCKIRKMGSEPDTGRGRQYFLRRMFLHILYSVVSTRGLLKTG